MRAALLASAALLGSAAVLPATAAEVLKNEKYGNDEAGVVLTCPYNGDDKGISGACQYYALYLEPVIRFTEYKRAVRGLW